jgi:hypothetical protein
MLVSQRWSRLLTALNVVALAIIFTYAIKELAIPSIAEMIYRDGYKELVFKCDNVMRDHFIAKRQVITSPSDQAIKNLHAAEVGLLACHDYDVLRKKLIGLGLSENQLSRIGLEAIEDKAKDVRSFVETHEIRY